LFLCRLLFTCRWRTRTDGVQIVPQHWREDVGLAVAKQIEAALGGWQKPNL
jgi:Asp-tRNA(Asn)/Glu-tRNA(Gln) amidotransferase A subunit family amidase